MDQSLFLKYTHLLSKNNTTKKEIIDYIYKKTNIQLSFSQVEIKTTTLTLYVSSAIKATLLMRGIHTLLKEKGFIYSL